MEGKQTEAEQKQRMQEREDLETPHRCTAEPLDYEGGVSLELIEGHANELNELVEKMMEDMMSETRILEGVDIGDYATLRDQIDKENRLTEEQQHTEMMEDMMSETRILEGVDIGDYATLRDQIDKENRLTEEQQHTE